MNQFCKEVRKAMIDRDMDQGDLARKMGVSQSYVSGILTGVRKPNESFMEGLRRCGIYGHRIEVAYVFARGVLDVSGIAFSQLSDLIRQLEEMRGEA